MLASSLYEPDVASAQQTWLTGGLLDRVLECRDRLRAHVTGHVASDGGVRDRCGSRVLESALVLHLLRVEEVFPGTQKAICEYLERQRPRVRNNADNGVAVFENALIDAALGTAERNSRAAGFLEHFEHFTSDRKRFMFHAILAELGVVPSDDSFELSSVRYDLYATWVNLEMCAAKILQAFQRGRPELAGQVDRDYLLTELAGGSVRSVYEADVFAHALALLAARRLCPGSPLVRDGIRYLLRCQNSDGGFPFIAGWEPFLTATAGLALAAAGEDRPVLQAMGEFVARHQGADGGWPYAPRVRQSDADCSPYCLEFLRVADPPRFGEQVARAENYLLSLVNEDGGFGTYRRGDNSEVGVTGSAVSALAPSREGLAETLDAAVRYLLGRQQPDGTYERGWSLSEANAIFRAQFALQHYPLDPPAALRDRVRAASALSQRYLTSTQNPDGGWGQRTGAASDVLSTSYSLLTLSKLDEGPALRRGIEYLIARQRGDGGYVSIPDSAGPRPIPHDAPVLADAFALLAVSHVLAGRVRGWRSRPGRGLTRRVGDGGRAADVGRDPSRSRR